MRYNSAIVKGGDAGSNDRIVLVEEDAGVGTQLVSYVVGSDSAGTDGSSECSEVRVDLFLVGKVCLALVSQIQRV